MAEVKNHGGPLVDFREVPPVGLRIANRRKGFLTLTGVEPYTNRKGEPSHLLRWVSDDGRTATTGMKSKGVTWDREVVA